MKCRFEHDGDCCNSGAKQYMCKCKQPCYTIVPITNADRIRAMSDKELAKYMLQFVIDCAEKTTGEECEFEDGAEAELINWLEQPAEV